MDKGDAQISFEVDAKHSLSYIPSLSLLTSVILTSPVKLTVVVRLKWPYSGSFFENTVPYSLEFCTFTSVLTMLTKLGFLGADLKLKSKTSVSEPMTGIAVCGGSLLETCITVMLVGRSLKTKDHIRIMPGIVLIDQ